jgi:tetratricopeptide (TPR) repeat protein
MTFMKVLPIYAGILVWPNNLHMERTVDIPTSLSDPAIISVIGLLALIGLLGYWLLVIRKNWLPIFALGWFFISIIPVSGLIPISQILAEHFLYLPSVGFFLLISWLFFSAISLLPISPRFRLVIFYSLITPISLILLAKTIRQNRVWRDPITFYEYTLAHSQPTARVYNNLAMAYADTKNHNKAIENYQKSIDLGDVYPNPHYNLGNTFIEIEENEKAEEEYKKALKIDPNFSYALLKLGQLYINENRIQEAKQLVCPVSPTQPLCLNL